MKTLQLEFYKIKRRKVWLTTFAMLAVQMLWGMWNFRNPKDWELECGGMALLYMFSLLDGVMMPTIMSVLASRLADIEHKGNTYKQLETLRSAGSLYHAKALCGSIIIAVMLIYVGDGKMVHAATPSRGVVIDPLRTNSVVFYARPY